MRKAGICTACFCGLFVTAIIVFLLLWGFPGLLNMDHFSTHYA